MAIIKRSFEEFLDKLRTKAYREIAVPPFEGPAVAVAHTGGNHSEVRVFAPVGFEAETWEDVLAFAKERPVLQEWELWYENASGNMPQYNTYFKLFSLAPELGSRQRGVIKNSPLNPHEAYWYGPSCQRVASEVFSLLEGDEARKRAAVKGYRVSLAVTEEFVSTGQTRESVLASYWRDVSVDAEVRSAKRKVLRLSRTKAVVTVTQTAEIATSAGEILWTYREYELEVARLVRRTDPFSVQGYREALEERRNALDENSSLFRYGILKFWPGHRASWRFFYPEFRKKGYPRGLSKRLALAERDKADREASLDWVNYDLPKEEAEASYKTGEKHIRLLEERISEMEKEAERRANEEFATALEGGFIENWKGQVDEVVDLR